MKPVLLFRGNAEDALLIWLFIIGMLVLVVGSRYLYIQVRNYILSTLYRHNPYT